MKVVKCSCCRSKKVKRVGYTDYVCLSCNAKFTSILGTKLEREEKERVQKERLANEAKRVQTARLKMSIASLERRIPHLHHTSTNYHILNGIVQIYNSLAVGENTNQCYSAENSAGDLP